MAKETAAQRKTRIGLLLADYDETSRALRKHQKRADELKKQIKEEVPAGTYGEWIRSEGTPREILDQAEAKKRLEAAGIPIPVTVTSPPVIVTHVASTK
jgi:hypothetical protein